MNGYTAKTIIAQLLSTLLLLTSTVAKSDEDFRRLYWKELDVIAHLDAKGRLSVSELHHMIFDGDWNGGERRFRRDGYGFTLNGVVRIDESGREFPLVEGDLSEKDQFAWSDANTLRWRARLPQEPSFDETLRVWRIDYTMEHVLRFDGTQYQLEHDFAFPNRPGYIRKFNLHLTLDPAWSSAEAIRFDHLDQPLPPGEGFIVSRDLVYSGAGKANVYYRGPSPTEKLVLVAILTIGIFISFGWFLVRETQSGRYRGFTQHIDPEWLHENVFCYPPEVVAALVDNHAGAHAVSAMLARMEQEGKLASRMKAKRWLIFNSNVLELQLLVSRQSLTGHELELVEALFIDGDRTDTEMVREHYRHEGFSPAWAIADYLDTEVEHIFGPLRMPAPWVARYAVALSMGISVLLFIQVAHAVFSTTMLDVYEPFSAIGLIVCNFALHFFGQSTAIPYRRAYGRELRSLFAMLVSSIAIASPLLWLIVYEPFVIPPVILAEAVAMWLLHVVVMLQTARTLESEQELTIRRNLRVARHWFATELAKPAPRLKDKWYPYILAFGLTDILDRWSVTHGRSSKRLGHLSQVDDSSRGTVLSFGNDAWTGGGGSFGGAGASGTWATALSDMSCTGYASSGGSSSGSSHSSSRGGSRTGGGGGGGW